ncbi:glucokinase [Stappia sp. ICDLI1TA098]
MSIPARLESAPSLRHFPFPVLVADIGGTNARFAIISDAHAQSRVFGSVATADYPDLSQAARAAVLDHTSVMPRTAVIAAAGPVTGERISLTNADWVIEPRGLCAEFGLERLVVLNDFEAQALALPGLADDAVHQIGGGKALAKGARVVLGPGTGLGVAAMVHASDTWVPIPGEGGHVELGPVSESDYRIWPHIERIGGRVSAERIISGSGLLHLARAVASEAGLDRRFAEPRDVTLAADAGDEVGLRTMDAFVRALGRVAGDFAITFLARGGVFLGGGIAKHIETYLAHPAFRTSFEAKAPHAGLMKTIPTFLIRHEQPALEGLTAFARMPTLFAVELAGRSWTAEAGGPDE